MSTHAKISGATPIATSNPFGTAELRPKKRQDDPFTALFARVRAAVARARASTSART